MAKAPVAGQVKTRLVPPLTDAQAADFYAAMLDDMIARLRRAARCRVHVAVAPATFDRARLPASWDVVPQVAGDLGTRLTAAFRHVFADGGRQVVALGVDSPTLPWQLVSRAFTALRRADVVLGPTEDGGCFAIGLRRLPPRFFAGIAWSTDAVCRQLAAHAARHGLTVRQLPVWYDIDTIGDVERHWASLARSRVAPRTRRWLLRQNALPLQRLGV